MTVCCRWINSFEPDVGCEKGDQKFELGVRYVGVVIILTTIRVVGTILHLRLKL